MPTKQQKESSMWILLLRFVAGYINMMTLLYFTHMIAGYTGSLTTLAMQLVSGQYDAVFRILSITCAFFIGSIVSGFIYPSKQFKSHMQYSYFLLVMAGILFIGGYLGPNRLWFLLYLSGSLGFQNGMFAYYRGMIVRTTALTGAITDIGVAIGRLFHGYDTDPWKIWFHAHNIISFVLGATLAASLYRFTSINLAYIAGAIDIIISVYFIHKRHEFLTLLDKIPS